MLDGVIDTGTAWLEEPDTRGDGRESQWPDTSRYRRRLRQFHDAGFSIATHAIGDRGDRSNHAQVAAISPEASLAGLFPLSDTYKSVPAR